ncbi:proline dehydrogenase family protein [Bacillus sp. D386]|uniref:proline dehydrogenase family protein n=1 Tax=Bacillus sp. D386 TaxID=2587155 RepID=UPI0011233F8A|nr:proline dehydrogenase family protein [Bacillus sp. D386]
MIVKDFFIALSENQLLNRTAQKYGLKMGAQTVVAGTNIDETIESIKELNKYGISCTVDNLGEFVSDKDEAVKAKNQILQVIEAIYENKVDAHISLKPSQLGLDIDLDFCRDNLLEIFEVAAKYDIFINIDMENHSRLQPSFDLVDQISEKYDNIGTVIQAYFHRAENDIQKYKNYRLRIVKGAYKEPAELAYQTKAEIDKNYINLIEYHLLNGKFTSIATHDHKVINHVKQFVKDHQIPNEKFEFQMLYGFRFDMQTELAKEGYRFCTYVPFGTDWYGYFMRRLAERPQNISLVTKQVFTKKTNTVLAIATGAFLLGRLSKRKK